MSSFICSICPRQCEAKRDETTGTGFCHMSAAPVVARAALHYGEEPCISGSRGSGTVFFSGCTLRCCYCQNHIISHQNEGKRITVERLADIFRELEEAGAHNINLVNPSHYADSIRKAIELYTPNIPVVYNSSGYERTETLHSLEGLVDVYLPDLKYANSALSRALSSAEDYFDVASKAIREMMRQTGKAQFDEQGMMTKGTMVRHLVLPGHTKNSMEVLDWLSTVKDTVWVSLMFQYTPCGDISAHKELQRTLTHRECEKVWKHMDDLGIVNGYVQDRKSAGTHMIPAFDLTGV